MLISLSVKHTHTHTHTHINNIIIRQKFFSTCCLSPMPTHCGLFLRCPVPRLLSVASHSAPKSRALSLWLVALPPDPMLCHCGLSPCPQIPCFSLWFVALLPNPMLCQSGLSPCSSATCPLTMACHFASKLLSFFSFTDAASTLSTQFLHLTFMCNNTGKSFTI